MTRNTSCQRNRQNTLGRHTPPLRNGLRGNLATHAPRKPRRAISRAQNLRKADVRFAFHNARMKALLS